MRRGTMKVQILSDLHNEFLRDRRLPIPDTEDVGGSRPD